jgi:tetratricopeptide (TPR) repeat protein
VIARILLFASLTALCSPGAVGQESVFDQAHESQNQGALALAEQQYRQFLVTNPKSIPAITNLGVVLAQQGKLMEAIEAYLRALRLDPRARATRTDLAIAYYRSQQWNNAVEAFARVLREHPEDRRCRQLLAVSLIHLGNFRRAAEEYEKLMPTDDPEVLVGLASCYKDIGRTDESDRVLHTMFETQGDSPSVLYLLGMADYSRGAYPEAVDHLNQSLKLAPTTVDAHFYLGATYFKLRNFPAAVTEWKLAQQLDPSSFPAIFASGCLLLDQHDAEGALPFLEHAYTLKPHDPGVQLALARAYIVLQRWTAALPLLQSATHLLPQSQPASFLLARTLKQLGHEREATNEFARCKTLIQKDTESMTEPTNLITR